MWYVISILTFFLLVRLFTIIGTGGQNNLIARNFFRGPGWYNGWRWFGIFVVATIIVALITNSTNVHIMPKPLKPYHMSDGFYWWCYTLGLFIFIAIWRGRQMSYLQQGGPFRSNFRMTFTTYAIASMICVSIVVTTFKIAIMGIFGARWASEQVEEKVDQVIEKGKEKNRFIIR